MKNVKYLWGIGLGCSLLLTGCGSGSGDYNLVSSSINNSLTCTINEGDSGEIQISKYEIQFNKTYDEVVGLKFYYTVHSNDCISDEEIDELKDYTKESWCHEDYIEKCDVSFEDNTLEIEMTISPSSFDEFDISGTREDIKKILEEDSFTCK